MILVLDIDATLANLDHRLHVIEKDDPTEEDWQEFESVENVEKDSPYLEAQVWLKEKWDFFDDVYFMTGRWENLRETTKTWLLENYDIEFEEGEDDHLIMRENDDTRASNEFKAEAILPLLADLPEDSKLLFIDDRDDNLEMFTKHGLTLKAPECWKLMAV